MSVVGMLALSYAFFHQLHRPQIFPFAYADNWTFLTTDYEMLFPVWCESTSISHGQPWHNMGSPFATGVTCRKYWWLQISPEMKINAIDLGCMNYTRRHCMWPSTWSSRKRHRCQCQRLLHLKLHPTTKANIISTSIWPSFFFFLSKHRLSPRSIVLV